MKYLSIFSLLFLLFQCQQKSPTNKSLAFDIRGIENFESLCYAICTHTDSISTEKACYTGCVYEYPYETHPLNIYLPQKDLLLPLIDYSCGFPCTGFRIKTRNIFRLTRNNYLHQNDVISFINNNGDDACLSEKPKKCLFIIDLAPETSIPTFEIVAGSLMEAYLEIWENEARKKYQKSFDHLPLNIQKEILINFPINAILSEHYYLNTPFIEHT